MASITCSFRLLPPGRLSRATRSLRLVQPCCCMILPSRLCTRYCLCSASRMPQLFSRKLLNSRNSAGVILKLLTRRCSPSALFNLANAVYDNTGQIVRIEFGQKTVSPYFLHHGYVEPATEGGVQHHMQFGHALVFADHRGQRIAVLFGHFDV